MESVDDGGRLATHRRLVEPAELAENRDPSAEFSSKEHVRRYVEAADEHQILMDRLDPELSRDMGGRYGDDPIVHEDRPGIGSRHPRDTADQRRLARAVVAEE